MFKKREPTPLRCESHESPSRNVLPPSVRPSIFFKIKQDRDYQEEEN